VAFAMFKCFGEKWLLPCLFVSPFGGAAIREVRDSPNTKKKGKKVNKQGFA